MATKRKSKVTPPATPQCTVESRPLGEDEKIEPGTLIVTYDRETGKEFLMVAQAGFGMNPNGTGKIIGVGGTSIESLQTAVWREKRLAAFEERTGTMSMVNTTISHLHRGDGIGIVTSPIKLSFDPMDEPGAIRSTAKEIFSYDDSAVLAYQIFRRFGRDLESALAAWERMLEISGCPPTMFMDMVRRGAAFFQDKV